MRARRNILTVVGAGVVIAFTLGAVNLMLMRFESGDVYPPYSSLRTDPLGAKAFYEALGELPSLDVRRNYTPLDKLTGGPGDTLMLLGVNSSDQQGPSINSDPTVEAIADFVSAGGRLVISLSPDMSGHWSGREMKPLLKKFGASIATATSKDFPDDEPDEVHRAGDDDDSDEPVPWHTMFYFTELAPEWREMYVRGSLPVIVERKFNKGSVVLSAGSFYLSNEAVWGQRQSSLLAWLIGSGREVIFDETHLGVVQEAGIAALGRKYGLAPTLAVLMLLGVLAIWKGGTSFLPRDEARAAALVGSGVSGKGSQAALLNLLRRSIPQSQLLAACLREWRRSGGPSRHRRPGVEQRIEAVVRDEQATRRMKKKEKKTKKHPDITAAYKQICSILSERKL